jgi:hypothetical protein
LFFFPVMELELRVFTLSHSLPTLFVKGFLEIGFLKLFAWASYET